MKKIIKSILIILNFSGTLCLIYYMIPYLTHNTQVRNPDAMLPLERWDAAGLSLTIGLVPLIIANLLAYLYVSASKKKIKLLWFLPSLICLVIVIDYWLKGLL